MGANLARHWMERGWRVIGWNRTFTVAEGMAAEGLVPARTPQDLVAALGAPRTVWLMLPAGAPTDEAVAELAELLAPGDTVVDGGNTHYADDAGHAAALAAEGIRFLDCGTSGGPGGARAGACLMIGGDRAAFAELEPLFKDAAVPDGYRFFGGAGAGHFVKMVHNGIEYGMMQAIAEGFAVMKAAPFQLDLARVADVYQHRSVVESRLVGWMKSAFETYGPDMEGVTGSVAHTGEGAWTVEAARHLGVPVPVIADALQFRKDSAAAPSYAGRLLSALRGQFGGHATKA